MKKVLILLSHFNGQQYLTEQLNSLFAQEGVSIHVFVRDDGSSTSMGMDIIRVFESKGYPISYIEGKNVGFAMSFSQLIYKAYTDAGDFDYFAFCDQDDVWLPDKLLSAVQALDKRNAIVSSEPIMYCSATSPVNSMLKPIRKKKRESIPKITKEKSLIHNCATGCTIVFNRKALQLYATHMPKELFAHDFMMYQLCVFFGQVIYDPVSHIMYRQHEKNQIGTKNFMGRMRERMNYNSHKGTLQLQGERFLSLYKDLMTVEDIHIISRLAFYHDNIFSKLLLLFNSKYRYNNMESNFFFILKVLIGSR